MTVNDVTELLRKLLVLYGPGLLDLEDVPGVRVLYGEQTNLLILTLAGREFRIAVTERQTACNGLSRRQAA